MATVYPLKYLTPFQVGRFPATDAINLGNVGMSCEQLVDMNQNQITGLAAPTLSGDLARKVYVEEAAQAGLAFAIPQVKVVTWTNQTLSGLPTIDGVTLTNGERILVLGQTTTSQDGIYAVSTGGWSRPTAYDDWYSGASASGRMIHVTHGTLYANIMLICTNVPGSDVVGTNDLTMYLRNRGVNRYWATGVPSASDLQEGEIVTVNSDKSLRCKSNGSMWKAVLTVKP